MKINYKKMYSRCVFRICITGIAGISIMLSAAGCSARNGNVPPSSVPGVSSGVQSGASSRLQSDESRLREDEGLNSRSSVIDETLPSDQLSSQEAAKPAMSTDFEEIGALDSVKRGWGPGRNFDTDNRPEGSLDYQDKYGKYGAYFIAPKSNKVYLTFDEGYENGMTASILDTLKEKNVKAVFFITYPYAKSESELVKRMIDEGHIIGNHSAKHLSFPDMSMEDAIADIQNLHEYVKANYGYTMTLFRPPMGEFSERTLALLQSIGYSSVFWSFAYQDWDVDNQPNTIEALDTITKHCHPGAIYLLHAVSATNNEVLGDAIDIIRENGYEFARWDWA